MNETVYLFIDGGYLHKVNETLFTPIFGSYPVDYLTLMRQFNARRVFFYDCVDDLRKAGESDADFTSRVEDQKAHFKAIDKVEGVHVRYGFLSPAGKTKQQKEVDVQLAVDMLTHSFARNMTKAVLLSGDRDFKPVVESVVRQGTYVQLVYDPKSVATELALAADSEMEIDLMALCQWAQLGKYEQRELHFPAGVRMDNQGGDPVLGMGPGRTLLRKGVIGPAKRALALHDISNVRYASVEVGPRDYITFYFRDEAKLLGYLATLYGEIVWS